MKTILPFLAVLLFILSCQNTQEQQTETTEQSVERSPYLELGVMCGTVQFSDGCSPKIDSLIQFGLALVHHMTFDDAEYTFNKVIKMDPDCFWGHWGKALSFIHPLWPDQPSNNQLRQGLALSQRALSLAKKEKEIAYGNALSAYYQDALNKSEKERLVAYEEGWKNAHQSMPDDLEAKMFYGLSRLSTVSPADKSMKVQKEVGAMAEAALEIIPDHPAGFHYAIHAYDYPPLAEQAMRVARNYSKIAPEIPHALHMPTHIFTRLGYWDESIEGNRKSADAAWKLPVDGKISLHYLHALDYMVYAHLQKSELEKANKIVEEVVALNPPFQANGAAAYAMAAMPARIALENRDWKDAAQVELIHESDFPWENFPQFSALVHFAQGIGAGRSGDVEKAEVAFSALDSLHQSMGDSPGKAYWAKQVEIQKTAVNAWIEYAKGNKDTAIGLMTDAALLEDSTEKSPVTPGELLPMREMLGDLYLEKGDYVSALDNYKKTLQRNPNRFNTIYGAAMAAEKGNNRELATTYYKSLIELAGKSNPDKEEVVKARNYTSSS